MHASRVIAQEEGLSGFWRGNYTNCVRIVPKSALQYATFGVWRPVLDSMVGNGEPDPNKSLSIPRLMAAGMLAGLTAQVATYPLDTIRARLVVDSTGRQGGILSIGYSIYKDGGGRGFYRGIGPTICGSVPYVGIEFSVYSTLKNSRIVPRRSGPNSEMTVVGKLGCGAVAATVGQTITYPFDLVRRRMQVAAHADSMRKYAGMRNAFSSIFRHEGIRAFYRGLLPNYLKSVPAVAITWAVYEETKNYLT